MNPAVFRYLPFAGFFFVCTTSRAMLLSILPLKALLLVQPGITICTTSGYQLSSVAEIP